MNGMITRWVAMTIYQATVGPSDRGSDQVLYTFESKYPHNKESSTFSGSIVIPGAQKLRISFDERSSTIPNVDRLNFHMDPFLSDTPKYSFSGTHFENFEVNGTDAIHFVFTVDDEESDPSDTEHYFGWKFDVRASFTSPVQGGASNAQAAEAAGALRMRLVTAANGAGVALLQKYLNSSDTSTRHFSAYGLTNILMTPHAGAYLLDKIGFQAFIDFPDDDACQTASALCFYEIMQDPYNRITIIGDDTSFIDNFFDALKAMCVSLNVECKRHAVNCIACICTEHENRSGLRRI
jgi:hypothetical protein